MLSHPEAAARLDFGSHLIERGVVSIMCPYLLIS
jgi:hypothetical protein